MFLHLYSKFRQITRAVSLLAVALSIFPCLVSAEPVPEGQSVASLGIGVASKLLCSAVFISNRDVDEALENSVWMPEFVTKDVAKQVTDIQVDRQKKMVKMSWADGRSRTAIYTGSQGCIIVPEDTRKLSFTPIEVKSTLPSADSTKWPMGDQLSSPTCTRSKEAAKSGWQEASVSYKRTCEMLEQAGEIAFGDPAIKSTSMVIVHRGQVLYERYAAGITKDTPLESWSMGKSMLAVLIGRLVQLGHFDYLDAAPISTWRQAKDGKEKIRIADLLQMSSGLEFSGGRFDPTTYSNEDYPDHLLIYTGAVNAAAFARSRVPEHPPGKVGRYRNSDPLMLVQIMRETLGDDEDYFRFPQKEVFDRIGARNFVIESDAYGTLMISGFDYGTARDWARLGSLLLNRGHWLGEQLIPADYVDFITTPAPGWAKRFHHQGGSYGGQTWLNIGATQKKFGSLPNDAYYFSGSGASKVVVVPSLELVVVRMGHTAGQQRARMIDAAIYGRIAEAFGYQP